MAIGGCYLLRQVTVRQLQIALVAQSEAIGTAVAHVAEAANDDDDVQLFLSSIATEPGVKSVAVAAGEPLTVVAASRSEWIGQPASQVFHHDEEFANVDGTSPIHHPTFGEVLQGAETVHYSAPLTTRLGQAVPSRWSPGVVLLHLDATPWRRDGGRESLAHSLPHRQSGGPSSGCFTPDAA